MHPDTKLIAAGLLWLALGLDMVIRADRSLVAAVFRWLAAL